MRGDALQEAYRENQRLIVENEELKRELDRLYERIKDWESAHQAMKERGDYLDSQLELNLQNVRYLFLHGGVSH